MTGNTAYTLALYFKKHGHDPYFGEEININEPFKCQELHINITKYLSVLILWHPHITFQIFLCKLVEMREACMGENPLEINKSVDRCTSPIYSLFIPQLPWQQHVCLFISRERTTQTKTPSKWRLELFCHSGKEDELSTANHHLWQLKLMAWFRRFCSDTMQLQRFWFVPEAKTRIGQHNWAGKQLQIRYDADRTAKMYKNTTKETYVKYLLSNMANTKAAATKLQLQPNYCVM